LVVGCWVVAVCCLLFVVDDDVVDAVLCWFAGVGGLCAVELLHQGYLFLKSCDSSVSCNLLLVDALELLHQGRNLNVRNCGKHGSPDGQAIVVLTSSVRRVACLRFWR
jgi:hypothetical protein